MLLSLSAVGLGQTEISRVLREMGKSVDQEIRSIEKINNDD